MYLYLWWIIRLLKFIPYLIAYFLARIHPPVIKCKIYFFSLLNPSWLSNFLWLINCARRDHGIWVFDSRIRKPRLLSLRMHDHTEKGPHRPCRSKHPHWDPSAPAGTGHPLTLFHMHGSRLDQKRNYPAKHGSNDFYFSILHFEITFHMKIDHGSITKVQ